jgi:hypothetical protein
MYFLVMEFYIYGEFNKQPPRPWGASKPIVLANIVSRIVYKHLYKSMTI